MEQYKAIFAGCLCIRTSRNDTVRRAVLPRQLNFLLTRLYVRWSVVRGRGPTYGLYVRYSGCIIDIKGLQNDIQRSSTLTVVIPMTLVTLYVHIDLHSRLLTAWFLTRSLVNQTCHVTLSAFYHRSVATGQLVGRNSVVHGQRHWLVLSHPDHPPSHSTHFISLSLCVINPSFCTKTQSNKVYTHKKESSITSVGWLLLWRWQLPVITFG